MPSAWGKERNRVESKVLFWYSCGSMFTIITYTYTVYLNEKTFSLKQIPWPWPWPWPWPCSWLKLYLDLVPSLQNIKQKYLVLKELVWWNYWFLNNLFKIKFTKRRSLMFRNQTYKIATTSAREKSRCCKEQYIILSAQ